MTSSLASNLIPPFARRFIKVKGLFHRKTDIYYHEPIPRDEEAPPRPGEKPRLKKLVLYIHGDVQDYYDAMMKKTSSKESRRYAKWNLEATAKLLATRFEGHHVMIVYAGSWYRNIICRHFNLVRSNQNGVPFFEEDFAGLVHTRLLVRNVFDYLQGGEGGEAKMTPNIHWPEEIKLVGFSKGSVVLNQFIHEIPFLQGYRDDIEFITRLRKWYWIDAGHPGGKPTYITDTKLLKKFSTVMPKQTEYHIVLSPYQIDDPKRPWIKEEEREFRAIMNVLNPGQVIRRVFFEDKPRSLDNHFELLNLF